MPSYSSAWLFDPRVSYGIVHCQQVFKATDEKATTSSTGSLFVRALVGEDDMIHVCSMWYVCIVFFSGLTAA